MGFVPTRNKEILIPGPAALSILLRLEDQEILNHIVRCHTSEQRLVRRAQIILKAHEGLNNGHIAQALNINRETVQRWRQRWYDSAESLHITSAESTDAPPLTERILSILQDVPRPGAPPRFEAQQVVRIVALACEDPEQSGRVITEWTPKELADESVKRGIVDTILARSIERFSKRRQSSTTP